MNRPIAGALLALIILLAIGLRFYGIDSRSLWLDEALSWKLQTFPVALLIQRTGEPTTTHPPLYFLLLRGWTFLVGDTEIAMRSLSVIFGAGTLLSMFLLLKSLGRLVPSESARNESQTTTAGILACLFLAVSNLHIYQAQQVRGYTLAAFLTVLSSYFLVRGLAQTKGERHFWFAYVISTIALVYTHNLGLFSLIAQWMFATLYLGLPGAAFRIARYWGRHAQPEPTVRVQADALNPAVPSTEAKSNPQGQSRFLRDVRVLFVLSAVVVSLAYVPWLTRSLGQSTKLKSSWTKTLSTETIPIQVEKALTGTSTEFVSRPTLFSWGILAALMLLGVVLIAFCGWPGFLLAVLGAVPAILIYVYSLQSARSIFDARYLMFAQQFWLAGAAWLISRVPATLDRIIISLMPLSWFAFWCFSVQSHLATAAQPGMRAAVAKVVEHHQPTDVVIAETPFVLFGSQYYARHNFTIRVCTEAHDRFLINGESQLLTTDLVTPPEIAESTPTALWVISSASYMSIAKTQFPTNCVVPAGKWKLTETFRFEQDVRWEQPVEVRHYVRQD